MRISFNPFANHQVPIQNESVFSFILYRIGQVAMLAIGCLACVGAYTLYKWVIKIGEVNKKKEKEKTSPLKPLMSPSQNFPAFSSLTQSSANATKKPPASNQVIVNSSVVKKTPTLDKNNSKARTSKPTSQHKTYKENRSTCSLRVKRGIVLDLTAIEERGESAEQDVTSVKGLLRYVAGSREIDLSHETVSETIKDIAEACNMELSVQLVDWLRNEETFHVQLLVQLLEIFVKREKDNQKIDIQAVKYLIEAYQAKAWYKNQNIKEDYPYSVKNPHIVAAVALIIKKDVNNTDKLIPLVNGIMAQKEFDLEIFSQWVQVFIEKEKQYSEVTDLHYPLLNHLIKSFQNRYEIKDLTVVNKEVSDYIQFKMQKLKKELA